MRYRYAIVVVFLLGIILFQPTHVFGAAYNFTWGIIQEGDQQKRRFAEIRVTYSVGDKVQAGKPFEVDVSLTYLKNEKSHFDWIDSYATTVAVRKSAAGQNLASVSDPSRVKLKPGDQYVHKFTVIAPKELDQYLLVLIWKTYNPTASFYGLTVNEGEIGWDTGEDDLSRIPVITVEKGQTMLTIRFENLEQGTIKVDGQDTPVAEGVVQLNLTGQHTIEIPTQVGLGEGVRLVFDKWSDGFAANSRQVSLDSDLDLTAVYKRQFHLSFASDQGDPQGEGWYDSGSQATISVNSPQPDSLGALGGKIIFVGWTGDVESSQPTATVTMDSPKSVRAEWRTDDSQAYLLLGGIAVALITMLVVVLYVKRRGRAVQQIVIPSPQDQPEIPRVVGSISTGRPPPQEGAKYCVHCGATIPSVVTFCTKCGKKQ